MNKRKTLVISCFLVSIVIVTQILGGYLSYANNSQRVTNERTSDEVLINWLTEDKGYNVEEFKKKYRTEEISIESSQGTHIIPATYIYAPDNEDRSSSTIIMVHGLFGNRISNYPVAEMFLEQGYNVVTYDQRSSGGNEAPYTTFGYLESKDLIDYVEYASKQMSKDSVLGAWGQSFGAATVENAMDEETFLHEVDFIILDCPMGDMSDAIHEKGFLSNIQSTFASGFFQLNLGFSYEDQSVYHQIAYTKIPVLVACSEKDEAFPLESVKYLYDNILSYKKDIFIVKNSAHSDIYFDYPEEYSNATAAFLEKYVTQE